MNPTTIKLVEDGKSNAIDYPQNRINEIQNKKAVIIATGMVIISIVIIRSTDNVPLPV